MSSDRGDDVVVSLEDVEVHFEEESGGGFLNLFSEPDTVHAVDGVSLDIHENEMIALIGESGCGKTTLGKTAIGLQRPTGGSVKYRGQDVWDAKDGEGEIDIPFREIRKSLQIIHQDPGGALNPNRKVIANLESPLKKWEKHLSKADRAARVLGLLERVGMTPPDDYAYRYPHQLSGGEKQRVALIRALLMNPDLILADEAISALDVSLRIEMMDLMHELQDAFDTSFLFISHDFSNARYLTEKVGGRIGVMYLGELVEIGPAEKITKNPQHPYTKALVWATPDFESMNRSDEMPIRKIDIPDPVDPPSGCRFHTRCPAVIQPDDLDLNQEVWGKVLDCRKDLEADEIDLAELERRVTDDAGIEAEDDETPNVPEGDLVGEIRREYGIEDPLSQQRAEDVLSDGLRAYVRGDEEAAVDRLRELFTTPCEEITPPREPVGTEHVAACLLHREEYTDGAAETTSGVADD
ncbi:ABC transporter ATP-binding protein [Halosolutus gelatinilyticus]|uniref:ABC transporter ATP-binding protein n=1 Tax=Halosolutus gelatinilyticus TaxID=2931975 RepID=UPI002AB2EF7E|nr:ABC transporter ATP-binding protein [Halosolutus gelatinilyticus]